MIIWLYYLFIIILFIILIILVININKILLKYNKKNISKKLKYSIVLLLIILFFGINEYWIHIHDQYKLFNKKIALPYLIMSFLPLENTINYNDIEIKLPYGYKTVNGYSAVSIINSINKLYDEMDSKFKYIDQYRSCKLWEKDDYIIFIEQVESGGIYFLFIVVEIF